MRSRVGSLLAVAATALATVVVVATPASAAPPVSISPGGAATATAGTTLLQVRDADGNITELTCDSAAATTNLGVSGSKLGDITNTIFENCLLGFIIQFEVTHVGVWELHGSDFNSATGVTDGSITNISAVIEGPGCLASVTGSVPATYTNGTGVLSVQDDFTLTINSVDATDDCLGLIHTGDEAAFSGDFAVSPVQTVS